MCPLPSVQKAAPSVCSGHRETKGVQRGLGTFLKAVKPVRPAGHSYRAPVTLLLHSWDGFLEEAASEMDTGKSLNTHG